MTAFAPTIDVVTEDAQVAPTLSIAAQPDCALTLTCHIEATWKRWLYLVLAVGVIGGFFFVVTSFLAPAPGVPGIDENAYLVAGKNIAQHMTVTMRTPNPFVYVGPMWNLAANGSYYPKYPAGVPILNAIAIWVGGAHGKFLAFYVSPICATLTLAALFLLTRMVAGSFLALMGTIILAANPTMLHLANVPSSHAPAICFATWGMLFLTWWLAKPNILIGIAAGLALAYTFSIRYSEGLLGLPLGIAALCSIRTESWKKYAMLLPGVFLVFTGIWLRSQKDLNAALTDTAAAHLNLRPMLWIAGGALLCLITLAIDYRRLLSYLRSAVPVIAWAIPVGALVLYNYRATGHFTGYDTTNESTGFTVTEFLGKWEFTAQQLYLYGLFLVLPLGLVGMATMFQRAWRLGLLMTLWFVPSLLLYTAYYWGKQAPGIGFLRFFLTLYPPIIVAAMYQLNEARRGGTESSRENIEGLPRERGSIAFPIGAAILTAASAGAGLYVALPDLTREHIHNQNLAFTARAMQPIIPTRLDKTKPQPIVFTDDGMFPQHLMYLQFIGDCEWYSADAFTTKIEARLVWFEMMNKSQGKAKVENDQDAPLLFSKERLEYMKNIYKDKGSGDLAQEQNKVMNAAIDAGRPVYALLTPNGLQEFQKRFLLPDFEWHLLSSWTEPVSADRDNPFARGGRFGGNNRSNGALAPPPTPNFLFGSGPQTLQLVQIVRKVKTAAANP